jgi:hypothetical protein
MAVGQTPLIPAIAPLQQYGQLLLVCQGYHLIYSDVLIFPTPGGFGMFP